MSSQQTIINDSIEGTLPEIILYGEFSSGFLHPDNFTLIQKKYPKAMAWAIKEVEQKFKNKTKNKRKPIRQKILLSLFNETEGKCIICRKSPEEAEIHHINHDPGDNDPSNLALLCKECHNKIHKKHDHIWAPWLRIVRLEIQERSKKKEENYEEYLKMMDDLYDNLSFMQLLDPKIDLMIQTTSFQFPFWLMEHGYSEVEYKGTKSNLVCSDFAKGCVDYLSTLSEESSDYFCQMKPMSGLFNKKNTN